MEDADSGQPKVKKKKTEKGNENGCGTTKIQVLRILTFVGEEDWFFQGKEFCEMKIHFRTSTTLNGNKLLNNSLQFH